MKYVGIAETRRRISNLVARAATGDEICITRHGKPIAKLIAIGTAHKPIDMKLLRRVTDTMPRQRQTAGEFVRTMRDTNHY